MVTTGTTKVTNGGRCGTPSEYPPH